MKVYLEKVLRVRQVLKEAPKPKGLYPNYINPKTGRFGQNHVSLGALGDSFYEYLLKAWLMSNKTDTDALAQYSEAMEALSKHVLKVIPDTHGSLNLSFVEKLFLRF